MSIKSSLKKIVEALGGTSNAKNIPGVIDEIATNATGGGESPLYIVTFTSKDEDETWECDKTFADILSAYESGKIVEGRSNGTYDNRIYPMCAPIIGDGVVGAFDFQSMMASFKSGGTAIDSIDAASFYVTEDGITHSFAMQYFN